MNLFFAETFLDTVSSDLNTVVDRIFNFNAIVSFVIIIGAALLLGRIVAIILRRINRSISSRADKSDNLLTVERLRRVETVIVISIALLRTLLFVIGLYIWWVVTHPSQQASALIGASAFFAILAGGVLSPVLRDLAAGSMMMTEHWFGVGDHIKVEPYGDMQGIVERVTLRSTRIRGLNGEVIWVNNQSIGAIRVTQKGSRSIAIELFVSDPKLGEQMVSDTNLRLPQGPLMMISPLVVASNEQIAENMWHIRSIGQTAPGREWLLEKYALEIMQELDEKNKKKPVLKSEPIARSADTTAEERFTRSFRNARKHVIRPTPFTSQLEQFQEAAKKRRTTKKQR